MLRSSEHNKWCWLRSRLFTWRDWPSGVARPRGICFYESAHLAASSALFEARGPMERPVAPETFQSKVDPQVFLDHIPVRLRTLVNRRSRSTTRLETLGIWRRRFWYSTTGHRRVWE